MIRALALALLVTHSASAEVFFDPVRLDVDRDGHPDTLRQKGEDGLELVTATGVVVLPATFPIEPPSHTTVDRLLALKGMPPLLVLSESIGTEGGSQVNSSVFAIENGRASEVLRWPSSTMWMYAGREACGTLRASGDVLLATSIAFNTRRISDDGDGILESRPLQTVQRLRWNTKTHALVPITSKTARPVTTLIKNTDLLGAPSASARPIRKLFANARVEILAWRETKFLSALAWGAREVRPVQVRVSGVTGWLDASALARDGDCDGLP